jgi:hypothetical protein
MRLTDEEIARLSKEALPEDSAWSTIRRREVADLLADLAEARDLLAREKERRVAAEETGMHAKEAWAEWAARAKTTEEEIVRLKREVYGHLSMSIVERATSAEARVVQLAAALRPFAAIGDNPDKPFDEYSPAARFMREFTQPQVAAARAALAEKTKEKQP